ncbi:MAG: hypothetical protein Q9168_003259 [Polycauliona sp. 1 TL-2023]
MASATADPTGVTPTQTQRLYESVPLSAGLRCIRVLDIQPSLFNGDRLVGNLRVVHLDSTPPPSFAALSYVWGKMEDAKPESIITCGPEDVVLQLTNNCHEALINLRAVCELLTIWVDAICIDQDNDADKNHQLPLMGEIYTQAATTYIWFGPSNESFDRAMTCLSTVGLLEYFFDGIFFLSRTLGNAALLRNWRTLIMDRYAFRASRYKHPQLADTMSIDLDQYIHFLDSIVRGLAEADFTLDVGIGVLFLLNLLVPIFWGLTIRHLRLNWRYLFWVWGPILGIGLISLVLFITSGNLRHTVFLPKYLWRPEIPTANMLLSAVWARECEQHKDFNFGLRNLMQALSPEKLTQLDYSTSLGDVYKDVTIQMLRLTGSAEILLAAMQSKVAGQPSWVVDWSRREPLRLATPWMGRRDRRLFYNPMTWLPSGSWQYDVLQPDILQIRTFWQSTVVEVLSLQQVEHNHGQSEQAKHMHNLEALLKLMKMTKPKKENWYILYRCLEGYGLERAVFDFLRTNRHRQHAEMLAILQSYDRYSKVYRPIGLYLRRRVRSESVNFSTHESMFRSFMATCNKMAKKQQDFVITHSGTDHRNQSAAVTSSSIFLTEPAFQRDEQELSHDQMDASQSTTHYRPQVGDTIVDIVVLDSCAVIRTAGARTTFVGAVEDLYWQQALEPHRSQYHESRVISMS